MTRPHLTVSLDVEEITEAKRLAEEAGLPLSRWLGQLIRDAARKAEAEERRERRAGAR